MLVDFTIMSHHSFGVLILLEYNEEKRYDR